MRYFWYERSPGGRWTAAGSDHHPNDLQMSRKTTKLSEVADLAKVNLFEQDMTLRELTKIYPPPETSEDGAPLKAYRGGFIPNGTSVTILVEAPLEDVMPPATAELSPNDSYMSFCIEALKGKTVFPKDDVKQHMTVLYSAFGKLADLSESDREKHRAALSLVFPEWKKQEGEFRRGIETKNSGS